MEMASRQDGVVLRGGGGETVDRRKRKVYGNIDCEHIPRLAVSRFANGLSKILALFPHAAGDSNETLYLALPPF